jgi:hypothetical protein
MTGVIVGGKLIKLFDEFLVKLKVLKKIGSFRDWNNLCKILDFIRGEIN